MVTDAKDSYSDTEIIERTIYYDVVDQSQIFSIPKIAYHKTGMNIFLLRQYVDDMIKNPVLDEKKSYLVHNQKLSCETNIVFGFETTTITNYVGVSIASDVEIPHIK
jgi:hypothetical protein